MNVFSTPVQYLARCLFISRFVNTYLLVWYTGFKMCKKMQQEEFVKVPYHNTSFESWKWNFVDQMDKFLPFLSCLFASFLLVCLSPPLRLSFPFYKNCFLFGLWTLVWSTDAEWCFTLHYNFQVKNCPSLWWPSWTVTAMRMWLPRWGERTTSSLSWPLGFHPLHHSYDSRLFGT